jgi:hypothetical protein
MTNRKCDYVARLIAGNSEAPARTRWWPRHSRTLARYVMFSRDTDSVARKPVRDLLMMGATEWEASICRGATPGLMNEHAALELAFADAAARHDTASMEKIALRFMVNTKAQTEFYGARVTEFPQASFYTLLMGHVTLFTESIRCRMAKDVASICDCETKRERNTLALAELTTEWL